MDFSYNDNQRMIADMVQQFGKQHITPFVREWDDNQTFPVEVFKKLGELGLMGVLVPVEYGGSGFSYTEYVTAIEELSILITSTIWSMINSMRFFVLELDLVYFYLRTLFFFYQLFLPLHLYLQIQ